MSDARRYAVWPDPRSRSRALESWKSFHFEKLSPLPFTMGAGNWPRMLKLGHNISIWSSWIFSICPSYLCHVTLNMAETLVLKSRPSFLYGSNLFSSATGLPNSWFQKEGWVYLGTTWYWSGNRLLSSTEPKSMEHSCRNGDVYSPAHADVTTSHQCCASYTGCQFKDE